MQKTYEVIYADPPWRYQQSTPTRKIENHYPTMSLEEIKELKVPAAKKSVLYLWTTTAKLAESISVIDSWGFEYKSSMVWDKLKYGMGFWFRGQHEFLLVATKGGFGPPPAPLRIRSIFQEARGKHSAKPTKIRELIASWYPEHSKLELFARRVDKNLWGKSDTDGWDLFGNEVENSINL